MKKMILMAAFAVATMITPAMAQRDGKGMKDPKARTEKMAEKLQFTDDQRAQLADLNHKYRGTEFDRKAYHQEFRAIMTEAQKAKMDEWRAQHKGKKGGKTKRS